MQRNRPWVIIDGILGLVEQIDDNDNDYYKYTPIHNNTGENNYRGRGPYSYELPNDAFVFWGTFNDAVSYFNYLIASGEEINSSEESYFSWRDSI